MPLVSNISSGPFVKMLFGCLAAIVVALSSGCAAYKPVPEGYTGPVATLRDASETEDVSKARQFYVAAIDGNRVENSRSVTRQASHGMGFLLISRGYERTVPVRAMKVKLIATHVVSAPIHELASRAAGTFFEVEGVVDFTPKAGVRYVVRGELKKNASSVWIEDEATNEVVTAKVSK
jgi:hypothetical protein